MDLLTTLALAVGLAMDSFSVSVCTGTALNGSRLPAAVRTGLVMGGFQALMPVLGWLGGGAISTALACYDHWIAFSLLLFIGGRMTYEALCGSGDSTILDASSWRLLLALGVATSIDALAVGFSLAFVSDAIVVPIVMIGLVTFALSALGVLIGCRASSLLKDRVPVLGGLLLVGIGFRILIGHLSQTGVPL